MRKQAPGLSLLLIGAVLTACGGDVLPTAPATPVVYTESPCLNPPRPTATPGSSLATSTPTPTPRPFGQTAEPPRYEPPTAVLPAGLASWQEAIVHVCVVNERQNYSTQTGLVVDPAGLVLTTVNLVAGVDSITVTVPGGGTRAATINASDPRTGAVLLETGFSQLRAAPPPRNIAVGEGVVAVWRELADGTLEGRWTHARPAETAPDDLVALGFPYPPDGEWVQAGAVLVTLQGEPVGMTLAAGGAYTGGQYLGGGMPGPPQPAVALFSALRLLQGSPLGAELIPAAVATYERREDALHGGLLDGPLARQALAAPVHVILNNLERSTSIDPDAPLYQKGKFLALIYPAPQELRTKQGKLLGAHRYFLLWWDRDEGAPDLVLTGDSERKLEAVYIAHDLCVLEPLIAGAPRSGRSIVEEGGWADFDNAVEVRAIAKALQFLQAPRHGPAGPSGLQSGTTATPAPPSAHDAWGDHYFEPHTGIVYIYPNDGVGGEPLLDRARAALAAAGIHRQVALVQPTLSAIAIREWHEKAKAAPQRGTAVTVHSSGYSQRLNRSMFSVTTPYAAWRLRNRLAAAGIPQEIVVVEVPASRQLDNPPLLSQTPGGIQIALEHTPPVAAAKELQIDLLLTNVAGEPRTFELNAFYYENILIFDAAGEEVWAKMRGGGMYLPARRYTFAPGEQLRRSNTWRFQDSDGFALPAGKYFIRGTINLTEESDDPGLKPLLLATAPYEVVVP